MTRPLIPFVQNGYYASRNWIPLVKGNGFTTSGGGEQEEVWETASGSIVTFDAVAAPLRQLSVAVEPVQNLNGYDNPWPAGGGKNKLAPAEAFTQTINGVTLSCDGNGKYTLSGTATGGSASFTFPITATHELQSGEYLHFRNSASNANTTMSLMAASDNIRYWGLSPANRVVNIQGTDFGKTVARLNIYVTNGTTADMTITPSIEADSAVTDWTPYSNICPITGWDSVKVNRTGKNLLPKMVAGTYTSSGITVVVDDTGVATVNISTGGVFEQVIIPLESGIVVTQAMVDGAYYHLNNTLVHSSVATTLESAENLGVMAPTVGQLNRIVGIPDTAVGKTINRIRFWVAANVTASGAYAPAFMLDSTATAYEPYNGNEYTIQLGEAVYGGTLDVVNGKMTVERGLFTFDGSQDEDIVGSGKRVIIRDTIGAIQPPENSAKLVSGNISNWLGQKTGDQTYLGQRGFSVEANGQISVADGTNSMTAEGLRAMLQSNPLVLALKLATPFELALTPQQISTLQGTNNVWSDAGDVTVEYRAQ